MTDLKTAAQQALQALEDFKRRGHWGDFDNLTGALKAALEADDGMYGAKALAQAYENGWNAHAQRKPLTEGEISNIWDGHVVPVFGKNGINPIVFARAIERAHGIGDSNE